MYLFEGLKKQASDYLPAENVVSIEEAFVVAHKAHDGQTRSSGEPLHNSPCRRCQYSCRYEVGS